MNLKGIISISGKPGLYRVVAQGKNNIIVESLEDKKRFPAYSSDRISALEDISIYTYDEDVALKEILQKINEKEKGGTCISHKEDKKKLENYLLEILPNFDQERVYPSDVKKIFQWYNLLHKSGDLQKEEEGESPKEDVNAIEAKKEAKKKIADDKKASKTSKETKPKAEKKEVKEPKAAAKKPAAAKSVAKATTAKKVTPVKTGAARGK